MCGIAGIVDLSCSTSGDVLETIATRMAATLRHRGPDDEGTWVDPHSGVALGHTRLAILDLSREGHQPMVSRSGRWVIVFNGEIYNFPDLRRELERQRVSFHGTSDTEVLLEAIDRWGARRALERSNGMFALGAWDREQRELLLARDRLGEKPLYYGRVGSHFVFASELKALRAHPRFDADIDRRALTLLLRHNYVPAPYSIYSGIEKLPPATMLVVTADGLSRLQTYWSLREVAERGVADPLELGDAEAVDALDALLRDSTRRRMVADVLLGAFLSGGIDSSSVVAAMQAESDRPVRTFTIGFHETGYDEAQHAKAVAHHLGTDHTELYVTPAEAQSVIPTLPTLYDEPYADSSQIPTTLVSDLARRHVTVALSGDGGDELFGGYTRYLFHRQLWDRFERLTPTARRTIARVIRSASPDRWDRVYRRAEPLVPARLRQRHAGDKLHKLAEVLDTGGAEAMYRRLVSHWDDPGEIVIGGREPATTLSDPAQWANLSDVTDRMMYLDAATYLPDDILVKVDRASMSRSLEVRVPMLDHRLVEFAWQLPQHLKIRDGNGKWLLRQVLARYVPPDLIERPKMGFGVPIGEWLRGPLRDWAEDLLHEDRLRAEGFFRPEPVRRAWDEHLSGSRDWKYHLWDVLMFQAWWQAQTSHAGQQR